MIRRNFLRCGMMGWCLELFWTGLHSLRIRDPKLTGRSSLWMFPIYGSAAFLSPIIRLLKKHSLWKRGLVYMLCIYAGEYISGSLLKKRNFCPWDYSRSRFHYRGLIRFDYAPLWFTAGLLFEKILKVQEKPSET